VNIAFISPRISCIAGVCGIVWIQGIVALGIGVSHQHLGSEQNCRGRFHGHLRSGQNDCIAATYKRATELMQSGMKE
jgi:hypothetical protein